VKVQSENKREILVYCRWKFSPIHACRCQSLPDLCTLPSLFSFTRGSSAPRSREHRSSPWYI